MSEQTLSCNFDLERGIHGRLFLFLGSFSSLILGLCPNSTTCQYRKIVSETIPSLILFDIRLGGSEPEPTRSGSARLGAVRSCTGRLGATQERAQALRGCPSFGGSGLLATDVYIQASLH